MPATKPFNLIYEGEWNDIVCVDYPLTPERYIAESIRPLANTQVDALFYNLCSSDGYCCQLENGEILMDNFDQLGDAWVWRYRENIKKMIEADANPPEIACEYGHRLGMKVIPIVRMNDNHDNHFAWFELSTFKEANPHLLIGYEKGYMDWKRVAGGHPQPQSIDSFTWGMFDFAHQEVRDHKFAIIEEFVTRWDNDGVSLDFDRDPWLFKEEGKAENAELITVLMRRIRKMVDDTAKQRGRPLYLHTRVLPDIQVCYNRGMDVETWVNEGLVDAITPGCGYMTFTQNLAPWVQLVAGKPCWIYPGNNHWKTPEVTRAWAKLMMQRGADGLYLFNWGHLLYGFDKNSSTKSERLGTVWYDEVHPRYYEVLNQIGVLKTMAFEDTVYNLESIPHEAMAGEAGGNHRRYRAIEPIELPIQLPRGQHCFNLPFAEDLQAARQVGFTPQLTLRFKLSNYTHPDQFDVSINSQRLDPNTRTERAVFIMANDTWFAYPLADSFLNRGNNAVVIDVHKLNPQMSVTPMLQNVELIVKYRPS